MAAIRRPRRVDEPPEATDYSRKVPSKQLDQPKPQPIYVVEQSVLTPEQEIRYLALSVGTQMAPSEKVRLLRAAGYSDKPSDRDGTELDLADIVADYFRDGTKPNAVIQFPDGEL